MRLTSSTLSGRSRLVDSERLDVDACSLFGEYRPQCFRLRRSVPHPLICAVELQEEFNRTIGWIDLDPTPQKLGACRIDLLCSNRIYSFITGCTAHRDRGRIMIPVGKRKLANFPSAQLGQSMARVLDFPSRLRCIYFQH